MQEEFLYLENKASRMQQLYWKVPLVCFVLAIIFELSPLSSGYSAQSLMAFAALFSMPFVLLGVFSGRNIWLNILKNKESPDNADIRCAPKRAEAFDSLISFSKPDIFSRFPYLMGFSAANGEALWLEAESVALGLAVFSKDHSSHLNFTQNIFLQHLLGGGSCPAIVLDLRIAPEEDSKISLLADIAGRREDLIHSDLSAENLCFNPFDQSHSTEQKAKKLILMTNLLLNNATTGSSFGAETEDFFFRMARCLDSFNQNWNLRQVAEFLQDFQNVSKQLTNYFVAQKKNQAVLDLAQLEKYMLKSTAASNLEIQKVLKILSLGLSDQFQAKENNQAFVSSSRSNLKEYLSLGSIIHFSVQKDGNRSSTNLVAGLLADELKFIFQSQDATVNTIGTPMVLVIADQLTHIPNLEAFAEIAKSDKISLIFSGGNWKSIVVPLERDLVEKKSRTIANSVFFNFQIAEMGQVFTQQGNIPKFWPLKVDFGK